MADVSIKNIDGGASRVLYEETTRLASRGHNVCILTRRHPETTLEEENINGVKEYRYEINRQNSLAYFFSTIKNSRRLFEAVIETHALDIIHFHQPLSALGVLFSRNSRPIKKVYTCHSLAFEEYQTRRPHPNRLVSMLHVTGRKWLERYPMKRSLKIITLSEFMKERVVTRHGIPDKRIFVIPGGVDSERFQPTTEKKSVRKELGLPQDRFVLFTVRNLVPRMGLENLIHAMEWIVKEARDVYLVVGGEGDLRGPLEALVKEKGLREHIRFEGFIAEEKLPSYYQAADLFILPTVCLEGFGLVTVEALASGVPVLGTAVGATPEILSKLDPGLLFKGPDPSSIAALILDRYRDFKKNPDHYFELACRCRSYAEENYTWQRHVDRLEAIYKDLLSHD